MPPLSQARKYLKEQSRLESYEEWNAYLEGQLETVQEDSLESKQTGQLIQEPQPDDQISKQELVDEYLEQPLLSKSETVFSEESAPTVVEIHEQDEKSTEKSEVPLVTKVGLRGDSSKWANARALGASGSYRETEVVHSTSFPRTKSSPECDMGQRVLRKNRSRRGSKIAIPGTGTMVYHREMRRSLEGQMSFKRSSKTGSTSSETEIVSPPGWFSPFSDLLAVRDLFLSSFLNILLLCIPLGVIADKVNWGPVAVFTLNFCGIIPLALMLGEVTEDLALRFGDVIGGLINATFGNVVELILSIVALQKNLYEVVQLSLLGSILSNMLLVLGCCFLFGGVYYRQQSFNQVANKVCNTLLFLSVIALVVPSALTFAQSDPDSSYEHFEILRISRVTAVMLAALYICYLVFQLYTHRDLFAEDSNSKQKKQENEATSQGQGQEEAGEEEIPELSLVTAMLLLAGISIVVAIASEYLTDAIDALGTNGGVSRKFLSIIILPIAGNACEHLTAVIVAMKNKMDLSLGVAIGSSIQIAIFAIPVVVLVGWFTDKDMTLEFDSLGVISLTVAVIHANFITLDGVSNWLMGLELITTFLIIAVAFWFR
eukprot:TRINITY_DN8943_c0_g3_i1.p1 TRINITY_DN8943_c0_g3~~TRINITY_DN8943_c0_g3_i1.p1  ORF type:complete len:601 (-),score=50.05 TRINITY_DN8943_c0_g3_i1:230-2032(-)